MIDLTRPALRGIQRRSKDPVKKERIGTLLKEIETRDAAFGDHRKRLDRYIAHQLRLLAPFSSHCVPHKTSEKFECQKSQ